MPLLCEKSDLYNVTVVYGKAKEAMRLESEYLLILVFLLAASMANSDKIFRFCEILFHKVCLCYAAVVIRQLFCL